MKGYYTQRILGAIFNSQYRSWEESTDSWCLSEGYIAVPLYFFNKLEEEASQLTEYEYNIIMRNVVVYGNQIQEITKAEWRDKQINSILED